MTQNPHRFKAISPLATRVTTQVPTAEPIKYFKNKVDTNCNPHPVLQLVFHGARQIQKDFPHPHAELNTSTLRMMYSC